MEREFDTVVTGLIRSFPLKTETLVNYYNSVTRDPFRNDFLI